MLFRTHSLGRQVPIADWLNETAAQKSAYRYWSQVQGSPFTALGYGELAFSTFYPNCRSVFGFYDHEGPENATYEVLGWYANSQDDILCGYDSLSDMESALQWSINAASDVPSVSLYYGRIVVGNASSSAEPPALQQVAIGNTGTEAVSAYLANVLSPSSKTAIEDQLESILMGLTASGSNGSAVDAGPNFEESRHERGFNSEDAGIQWTLRQMPLGNSAANTADFFDIKYRANLHSHDSQLILIS